MTIIQIVYMTYAAYGKYTSVELDISVKTFSDGQFFSTVYFRQYLVFTKAFPKNGREAKTEAPRFACGLRRHD